MQMNEHKNKSERELDTCMNLIRRMNVKLLYVLLNVEADRTISLQSIDCYILTGEKINVLSAIE